MFSASVNMASSSALAKYISKPEPSANIKLPENTPTTLKYLRNRVVGAYEAIELLMGFLQSLMIRQAIYLPTQLVPLQRMLKRKSDLNILAEDSEDVYLKNRLDEYFQRPSELSVLTYPEFYQWWRKGTSQEQKKAEAAITHGEQAALHPRGSNDFDDYQLIIMLHQSAVLQIQVLGDALQLAWQYL